MVVVNVLVLGMEGAGKTLLLRRLAYDTQVKSQRKTSIESTISADVVPTAGVELVEVPLGKKSSITFRELGGCMLPLWPTYYSECEVLAFVIDMASTSSLATSCVMLHQLLNDDRLKGKPVALLLNKQDLPATLSRAEIEQAMLLQQVHDRHVEVLETSAWTGDGASELLSWIARQSDAVTGQ